MGVTRPDGVPLGGHRTGLSILAVVCRSVG